MQVMVCINITRIYFGTRVELLYIPKIRCEIPLSGCRILRQAQNKFEPRLNCGGISLTLNLPTWS